MTIRKTILAIAVAFFASAPAQALDLSAMSDAEREAFRAEVRAYLLENPEVLMEAIGVLEERQAAEQAMGDRERVEVNSAALFEDGFSWIGGNPNGDVTVVEFMDYRCSYCRRAHPEVEQLINADQNIRFIVKEYPILGPESVAASKFAIATKTVEGDEAYKNVHDALIRVRGSMNDETFGRIADEFGLDMGAIHIEMQNPAIDALIQENYRLAERLEISGTPSFVFQTEMVRGYVPLASMQSIVTAIREGS